MFNFIFTDSKNLAAVFITKTYVFVDDLELQTQ